MPADRRAYMAAYYQRRKRSRLANRRCVVCGALMELVTSRRKYCDRSCEGKAYRLQATRNRLLASHVTCQ